MVKLKHLILGLMFMFVVSLIISCGGKAEILFEEDTIYTTVNHEFKLEPIVKGESKDLVFDFNDKVFEKISENTFKVLLRGEYQIKVSIKDNSDVSVEVTIKANNNHTFDQKNKNEEFLLKKVSCGEIATYYYSCICGEKGTETFEDGDPLAHNFEVEVIDEKYICNQASCTEKAKYYYSCACGEKGTETFETGELLEHTYDQKVIDDKFVDENNNLKYYYSCICGEKGTETFYNVNPVEVHSTLADDDVSKLEPGSIYEYNGTEYIVGETVFASVNDAIKYAKKVVYIADGVYNELVTINKSNFKIYGNNTGIDPNIATRNEESIFTNKLVLDQDVKNVLVSGLYFTLDAQFKCSPKGGNDDIVFEYNVFDNEITTVSGYPNGGEIMFNPGYDYFNRNLTVKNNRFLSTGGKTYHLFIKNLENLKVTGNYFEGTYAQVYADSIIFDDENANYGATGNLLIENNEFVNICQYAIIFWDYYNIDLKIIGNKFKNCGIDGANDGYIRAVVTLVNGIKNTGSTVLIEKNEMENVDSCVRVQYGKVAKISVNVKDNMFVSWAEPQLITDNDLATEDVITVESNYYGQEVNDDSFKGVISWATPYTNINDVPKYEREDLIYVTELSITNKVDKLPAYSEYKIQFTYKPDNATYTKVIFKSSDESVATVSDRGTIKVFGSGKATITAYCVFDETIVDSFEFEVKQREMIDASYDGNGVLKPGESVQIYAEVKGIDNPGLVTYTSSDESIATVDEGGLLQAKGAGLVVITIKYGDLETQVGFTVLAEDQKLSDLMQLLVDNNNGTLFYDVINYIGYEEGFESVPHKLAGPVNAFWSGELPEVIKNMVPETNTNYTGQYMTSVEYIVFHDTGSAGPGSTAERNSGWCVNPDNTGTSWHYSIGNDGIYQQLEDNMIAWHAGDWSQKDPGKFAWYDTGIKYTHNRPEVTVGDDGYFYIEGAKTLIKSPLKEDGTIEKNINKVGLVCVKGENGNYMIPTTWVSDESGYPVCVYGGNSNGIGIESCVNSTSDVWLTWQYSAKFIAQLLIKHNLHSDRLVFHNNFTNKTCPNTLITNNLLDEFIRLVEVEYEVAKNYSDYEITFTSHNSEIMDNTGRIVSIPDYTTNVTYTISITKDGVTEEVTLNALVPGRFGLK